VPGRATIDWSDEICIEQHGFFRMIVTVTDFHGNTATDQGSWYEQPSGCCEIVLLGKPPSPEIVERVLPLEYTP
jgi:hypothetical protein